VVICFAFLVYSLAMKFTGGDSVAASLSLPLWAFSGGLGFLEGFDFGFSGPIGTSNFIHDFHNGKSAFWFQSIAHIYHPQRSATFAMPLCWIVIHALITGVEQFEWRLFALAAIVTGITPQTQVHAFAALAIFALTLAVLTFPLRGRWIRAIGCWGLFGILANLIALPLSVPFLDRSMSGAGFFAIKPVWRNPTFVKTKGWPFFEVWWRSLGVFGAISLVFGYAVADAAQIWIYGAAMAVFWTTAVVMFQPWELDNCKIFQDGWMPLACPFVAQFFSRIWKRSRSKLVNIALVLLFFSAIASGCLNLWRYEGYSGYLYDTDDRDTGFWAAENTPIEAIFQSVNNEVMIPPAVYAGRRLFVGYMGWIYSHGLRNASREYLTGQFELGDLPREVKKHDVTYAVKLKVKTPPKFEPLENKPWWVAVMKVGQYEIWRLDVGPDNAAPAEDVNATDEKSTRKKKKKPKQTKKPPSSRVDPVDPE
jgi:hypothetical protein